MSRIRVAAAQIECRAGNIPANLEVHLQVLQQAKRAGAELVVFPELSLSDYLIEPDLPALGRDWSAPEIARIAAECTDIAAVVGVIEHDHGHYYNAAAVLRDGRVQAIHRKINLPSYGRLREREFYRPGDAVQTWTAARWQIATLICADSWNPALPWLAALNGSDLLVLPIASALDTMEPDFDNPAGWDVNLRHTALTYGLPVIMCNHCGRRADLTFWGGSRILDAQGKILALAGASPELLIADISLDDVQAARTQLPTMKFADPELVATLIMDVTKPKTGRAA